ncbi:MAG: hypothetical protein M3178_12520 [Pseudomonadota bacterium]|nr:hypothetical protein [Pseudomonadota bacterium]
MRHGQYTARADAAPCACETARAGRFVLYPFGLVTAALAMREGLVKASSRSNSLSRASVNNP